LTPVEGKPETIFEYLSSMLVVSSFLPVLYAASTITHVHIHKHIHMVMEMDTYTDINSTVVRTHKISRRTSDKMLNEASTRLSDWELTGGMMGILHLAGP
jgi:hypothetical protein